MDSNKELVGVIDRVLSELNNNGIICAIRRNDMDRGTLLTGDVDILIAKKSNKVILDTLREHAQVIRVFMSYGGIKIWITTASGMFKEVDFIWRVCRQGITLMESDEINEMLSFRFFKNGSPVLPLWAMGKLICLEKTAEKDYERYFAELQAAGLRGLTNWQRAKRLFGAVLRKPVSNFVSVIRFLCVRSLRLIYPMGMSVKCAKPELLSSSQILSYLFDRKIYANHSGLFGMFMRNFRGGLVIKRKGRADIEFSKGSSLESAEEAIIDFLKERRSGVPKIIDALS